MLYLSFKQMILLFSLTSCSGLNNGTDAELMQCGEHIPTGKKAVFLAGDPLQVLAFQALPNDELAPVVITKKGCVFIDPALPTVIRSIDLKSSLILKSYQETPLAKNLQLTQHGMRPLQTQCPQKTRTDNTMTMESWLSANSVREHIKIQVRINGHVRRLMTVQKGLFNQADSDGLY
jgi:hypothetical protein